MKITSVIIESAKQRSMRLRKLVYLLQSILIVLWWLAMATSQVTFEEFQFKGLPAIAFWAFLVPDGLLIIALSTLLIFRPARSIELIITGAYGYAALYCFGLMILTGSGYLPTGTMTIGFSLNLSLAGMPRNIPNVDEGIDSSLI